MEEFTVLETIVNNHYGIHARPSSLIAKTCFKYERKVYLSLVDSQSFPPDARFDCRSVMDLLTMEASKGAKLNVYVEGTDEAAKQICEQVRDLVSSNFDEAYK